MGRENHMASRHDAGVRGPSIPLSLVVGWSLIPQYRHVSWLGGCLLELSNLFIRFRLYEDWVRPHMPKARSFAEAEAIFI